MRYKVNRLGKRWLAHLAARSRIIRLGGMASACRRAVSKSERPNIILVTLDSLRADRVGYLGCKRNLMPNLDALAEESVRFTRAIVQAPWTKPSVGAMLTGLYPSVHGANTRGEFGAKVTRGADRAQASVMKSGVVTLSELLAKAGYTTAAFTGGGFTHALYQGQGFHHFFGSGFGLRDLFYQCARWLSTSPPSPFFVWIHAYDTHRPYRGRVPLSRFLRRRPYNLTNSDVKEINSGRLVLSDEQLKRLIALYDQGVRGADRQIGFLLDPLQRSGLLDQSVFVFSADHGEALYEHRLVEHWDVIYNEVLHVPLLMRIPGVDPRTVDQYVQLMDLMPTLLDVADVPSPSNQATNLMPAILDDQDLGIAAFSEIELSGRPRALQAILEGRAYKVIRWLDHDEVAFFDLSADPREQHHVMGQGWQDRMLELLNAQLEENQVWAAQYTAQETDVGAVEGNREVEQRLRELGYIE